MVSEIHRRVAAVGTRWVTVLAVVLLPSLQIRWLRQVLTWHISRLSPLPRGLALRMLVAAHSIRLMEVSVEGTVSANEEV